VLIGFLWGFLVSCASSDFHREVVIGDLVVHVVGDRGMLPGGEFGCVRGNELWVYGSKGENGEIEVSDMVLGHEMRHVLRGRDKEFKNPDEDLSYRIYRLFLGD